MLPRSASVLVAQRVGPTASTGFWSFDPLTGQYRTLTRMPTARLYFGLVALLNGRIAAVGGTPTGSTSNYLGSVSTFTVGSSSWR